MITSGCYSCLAMTSDSSGISDANDASGSSDVMSMLNVMFKVDTRENSSDTDTVTAIGGRCKHEFV